MNQFKLIYILLFCIMIAKPISNVISTHENGLPKLVNTYELKSKGLTLKEQQFFYDNGALKAKGVMNRDQWKWSYYSIDGDKIGSGEFENPLDTTAPNLNKTITEIQNNQLVILKKVESLAKNQQNRDANAKKNNQKNQKKQPPQADPNKVYNIPIGESVVIGNPSASVTIIEWTDFQ